MKTAMQEHIEWLKRIRSYTRIPDEVIEDAENGLKKEKEQIIDAYFIAGQSRQASEQYYNETFKNKH